MVTPKALELQNLLERCRPTVEVALTLYGESYVWQLRSLTMVEHERWWSYDTAPMNFDYVALDDLVLGVVKHPPQGHFFLAGFTSWPQGTQEQWRQALRAAHETLNRFHVPR